MRYALSGSVLVHVAALGAGLLMFTWPDADDAPAAQAVSVEVISIASVSANQTATIKSDAAETLVSSGAEALSPTTTETIETVEPETVQLAETSVEPIEPALAAPVEPETAEQTPAPPVAPADPIEIVETEPERVAVAVMSAISPLQTETVAPVPPTLTPTETPAAIQPAQSQAVTPAMTPPPAVQPLRQVTIEPTEVTNLKLAPTPHVLTRPRPSEPTQRPHAVAPKPPARQRVQPRPTAPAGNGGQNQADAVAARPSAGQQGNSGSGGNADVAKYPSQVLSKLRRALRYPGAAGGAAGEVQVQFIVSARGEPSGLRVVKSSGNAAIDRAGLDTVMRAAPFPPIPPGAQRNSWGFTIPLAFVRG